MLVCNKNKTKKNPTHKNKTMFGTTSMITKAVQLVNYTSSRQDELILVSRSHLDCHPTLRFPYLI